MVRILYDYDIRSLLKGEYYNISTNSKSSIDIKFIDDLLKQGHHIFNFHYIGGGADSVTIIDDISNSFYIIEPINGLVFAYEMTLALNKYEKQVVKKPEFDCSLLMDETIFRHHRNDDEYLLLGKILTENNNVKLQLKYPNSNITFYCDYIPFVTELLIFEKKMIEFHSSILPNFKQYPWYEIFMETFAENNILRQKYANLNMQNDSYSFLDTLKIHHPA